MVPSKVVLVHRHGSRGPAGSELCPFPRSHPVVQEWDPHELENVSAVGQRQMETLGRWFSSTYAHLLNDPSHCKWRTSASRRAHDSSETLTQTINETVGKTVIGPRPLEYSDGADSYFREWGVNSAYKRAIKEMQTSSEQWREKCAETSAFTSELYTLFENAELPAAEERLYCMTYVYCVQETERFWHEPRNELISLLSPQQQEVVEQLALWVWNQRFFACRWGPVIGGKISREIVSDLGDANIHVSVYGGHDYTILSILGALGLCDRYPSPVPLGYGSFLVFELFDDDRVRISLNFSPFKLAASETAVEELQHAEGHVAVIREAIPLAELEAIVAALPQVAQQDLLAPAQDSTDDSQFV